MDKTTLVYLPFVVGITFCASLLSSASVIVDNPLDDSDMNGINASVWQDLPLEMDDKSPIVLIAKPFSQMDSSVRSSNASDVRMNQTEDFFASIIVTATPPAASNQLRKSASADGTSADGSTSHESSPAEGSFVSFANFRKKFSRLIPL
ncbi:hypothetical protein TYRP_010866 [Tyrophagus putrescentiae]|nr:hypothetical protein TYRP_010866 [Tyrophagus putrescentiae]